MPLYEFQCDACGKRFEHIQKSFSDAPLEVCALCGKGPVHRLLSSPAIQFKGSGFYITDYAKKGTSEAGMKSDKSERSEQSDKGDKADKGEKTDKGEKSPKSESGGSTETKSAPTDAAKATASADTAKSPSPSSSTPSAPSSTSGKDS